MIRLKIDQHGNLTQWDKDRYVIIEGVQTVDGIEVHFSSPSDEHGAYVVQPTVRRDGVTVAAIPNVLLTESKVISIYLYPESYTKTSISVSVAQREKPDDYIYTETEVLNYKHLDQKIGDLSALETENKTDLVSAINEANKSGGGSGGMDAIITITKDSDGVYHADKTFDEIVTLRDTYVLYAKFESQIYPYTSSGMETYSDGTSQKYLCFVAPTWVDRVYGFRFDEDGTVRYSGTFHELPERKKNDLSDATSGNATIYYPSVKAVYDAIKDVKDEISTVVSPSADAENGQAADAKETYEALSEKMNVNNPTGTGVISIGRKDGTAANGNALGSNVTSSGANAFAEGEGTKSTSDSSHAEGYYTSASGFASHAEGSRTEANTSNQHVQGKYNKVDSNGKYAHIVGNGTSVSERSNAHTLDWDGNAWFAGDVLVGGESQDDAVKLLKSDAIATDVTEKSTDNQIASAKAVYDMIGDVKSLIDSI